MLDYLNVLENPTFIQYFLKTFPGGNIINLNPNNNFRVNQVILQYGEI